MGMAIHFHGRLRSTGQTGALEQVVRRHAALAGAALTVVDDAEGELGPFLDEGLMDCSGPLRGWILSMHRDCEPVFLVSDPDGRMACTCKTQFAPLDAHKRIVALLKEMAPFFVELTVADEGGYWETGDEAELLARRNRLDGLIDMLSGALRDGAPRASEPKGHSLN